MCVLSKKQRVQSCGPFFFYFHKNGGVEQTENYTDALWTSLPCLYSLRGAKGNHTDHTPKIGSRREPKRPGFKRQGHAVLDGCPSFFSNPFLFWKRKVFECPKEKQKSLINCFLPE